MPAPAITVERVSAAWLDAWADMRHALWPEGSREELRAEAEQSLATANAAFIALDADGAPVGFCEVALRHDYVNGCETSPVAFLEGIFVAEPERRRGVARALVESAEGWAREAGCSEFASDALLGNQVSHRMHAALGFRETERVVFFRRSLR